MCLILFAYGVHLRYDFVIAANRDEFYERPATPLHYWEDYPEVLAGRDLRGMGTWLGISRDGRLAALTNFRDPSEVKKEAPSRGNLVADFLKGGMGPSEYLEKIRTKADTFKGFNLLVGDGSGLYYASNRGDWSRSLQSGIYGLSNHLLDTPWPKVCSGVTRITNLLTEENRSMVPGLEDILTDRNEPPDNQLPDTGVGPIWERLLAPIFVASDSYGTRCSSIVTVEKTGHVQFMEITWEQGPKTPRTIARRKFDFHLSENRNWRIC